jgi:hypothetical protein
MNHAEPAMRPATAKAGSPGLHRFTLPAGQAAALEPSIHFDRPVRDPAFEESLGKLFRRLALRPGMPGPVQDLRDVYYLPRWHCLYDAEGRRIEDSTIRRGGSGAVFEKRSGPPRIAPPAEPRLIDEPVLFGGVQYAHWGHFLTEALSRVWALEAFPDLARLPVLAPRFGIIPAHHTIQDCLRASAFAPERVLAPEQPVRLRRCILPPASFVNRGAAFAVHAALPRAAAARALGDRAVAVSDQPVYLSRTRLRKPEDTPAGEPALEAALAARGVLIMHPQTLRFAEQAAIYRGHRVFIGCSGSAFLNACFAPPRTLSTFVLRGGQPNANYLMMDAICGVTAHYIDTLRPVTEADGTSAKVDRGAFEIDVGATLAHLASLGVIPAR